MTTQLHRLRSRRANHPGRGSSAGHHRTGADRRPVQPEDAALYICGCGHSFTAAVTAGVTCPHCGDGQAW
jgi:hypothetical protein